MRIFFASSDSIALEVLRKVSDHYNVVGVLTAPDKPSGRGLFLKVNDIKVEAINRNITVLDPVVLNSDVIGMVKKLKPDLMLVFSYGKIFRQEFLDIFPMGCINVHPSLLPKYRGPSPIQTAILNGDTIGGITVQKMALEMDSGNILAQSQFEIKSFNTSADIFRYVSLNSFNLVLEALSKLNKGHIGIVQDSNQATYCSFFNKQHRMLNFNLSAFEIKNKINACNPWPLARAKLDKDEIIFHRADFIKTTDYSDQAIGKIVSFDPSKGILVKTEDGILLLLELQRSGRKVVDYKSFYNGNRDLIGKIFS
ncbi:methionyl-tRNA formyltransferase [Borrelia turicatae]|uniref:Methionyl-tRNA formyltransferase n=2 Tax=Borrelia turicatae TaxID=142 RepID=FMT_BORT9|nr:methionyl-tRNA formyltransferase [Borrelia turicatae]A1QYL4.1 RecName: Full=Methionyl-tRNA formyltransferase [Borrelia turicatae 91E135]AAX17406.1 methionyl-tRNA formyltransferase [Borrelia turicatae 91E135]ANF33578.1 methionyl-tRNA formyltransferase [Borrelia turicatae]UPA12946.1 methionyl-tRNA formyltransferase [Borrelia turicatae 91E135]UPA14433.1 methionyl-tRNA formyltransferase [Borrelia turicatae]